MVRKVDRLGRIGIPVKLRQEMNIEMCDDIEIFVEDENIVLRKVQAIKPCIITGEISDRNLGLANGELVLSPEGVRTLLKELKKYTSSSNSIVL
jgi:AbrB family transcriptional regulator, transcriptional pleiotropic regulator of transition state genes